MANTKLTTVKLLVDMYNDFKVTGFHTGFTLQKLVNRSMYLYNTDADYRQRLQGISELQIVSGSRF